MLGIIIQARMGSTRLPGKVLKPLAESTILGYLVEKLSNLKIPAVVATTQSPKDDRLANYLIENNIPFYRGSENNVLQRYIDTARVNDFDKIIRVCSDSPFIDLTLLKELVNEWDTKNVDYFSYSFRGKPTVLSHFGVFAELVTLSSLEILKDTFTNKEYEEHVTYGIYKNPENFKVRFKVLPDYFEKYESIRLTIDTSEDYKNITNLLKQFPQVKELEFDEIADIILRDNSLLENMRKNIMENQKR